MNLLIYPLRIIQSRTKAQTKNTKPMKTKHKLNLFTAALFGVFTFTIISANAVGSVTEPIGGQPAPGGRISSTRSLTSEPLRRSSGLCQRSAFTAFATDH